MGAKSYPRQGGESPRALTHQVTVHAVGDGVPLGHGGPDGHRPCLAPGPCRPLHLPQRSKDLGHFQACLVKLNVPHPKPGGAQLGVQAYVSLGSWATQSLCTGPPHLNPSWGHGRRPSAAHTLPLCLAGGWLPTPSPPAPLTPPLVRAV